MREAMVDEDVREDTTPLAEAVSACLALPPSVEIGDQRWLLLIAGVSAPSEDCVTVRVLLSGPYGRHRRVRLDLRERVLRNQGYDGARAAEAIVAWLPNSDEHDVLELTPRELASRRRPAAG